ncbi:MAG: ORF6N domain-containing protein [Ruminococcus sp.]|nr:ORF6N domain-containing protein [Ruminococcus sp.]
MYELINDVPVRIKEYNGQRVVTFKDIDKVHNRPEGTARRNFNTNREYFVEGEDFLL